MKPLTENSKIKLTVGKCPDKRGYSIFHNQPNGWYGTYRNWFGWYKYKSDAVERANELETSFHWESKHNWKQR